MSKIINKHLEWGVESNYKKEIYKARSNGKLIPDPGHAIDVKVYHESDCFIYRPTYIRGCMCNPVLVAKDIELPDGKKSKYSQATIIRHELKESEFVEVFQWNELDAKALKEVNNLSKVSMEWRIRINREHKKVNL